MIMGLQLKDLFPITAIFDGTVEYPLPLGHPLKVHTRRKGNVWYGYVAHPHPLTLLPPPILLMPVATVPVAFVPYGL